MPSPVDDIKARLDIVELVQSYIRLQKAGANWKALCPFHSEKTPSFNVSPTRQIWHCFGCGKGGDHFKFVMEIEGLEFKDALELLAKRAGIQLRREDPKLRSERTRLYALVEEAARIFESVLHRTKSPERLARQSSALPAGKVSDGGITAPLAYLKKRGLTDETVKSFRIGYAPDSWDLLLRSLQQKGYGAEEAEKAGLAVKSEQGSYYDRFRNRITFPIADASGRVVGFSGRIFDSNQQPVAGNQQPPAGSRKREAATAKYINTPQTPIYDKSRVLYGFDKAKEEIRKQDAVILVEGQMDVAMSHQAGVKHAVAVSGTALTGDQLKILRRLAKTIISSFDRDQAGELATKRSLDLAAALGFERKAARLPGGAKDPADAVAKNPELWLNAVATAQPIAAFHLETALAKYDRQAASGKRAIAEAVLPEIQTLVSEVERTHWMQELSRAIGIPEEALWRELRRTGRSLGTAPPNQSAPPSESNPDRRSQLESLLLGTLILNPEARAGLPALPRHVFRNGEYLSILDIIESALAGNVRGHAELLAAIPGEFRDTANYLAFQAEVILGRIENGAERARELLVCMKELEHEWARDRLRTLGSDISAAERNQDRDKLSALLAELHAVSAKIM